MSEASLANTYWRIVQLRGEPVPVIQGRREPHLVLQLREERYAATVGCNQFTGSYTVTDDGIEFGPGASTRMACPPRLQQRERKLAGLLTGTRRSWQIDGRVLEIFDEAGESLATLEAVYLP